MSNKYIITILILFILLIFITLILAFLKKNKNLNDKKITIVALHLGNGGVEKFISNLVKMLCSDYEIEIISSYKMSDKLFFEYPNTKIKFLINDHPYKNEFIEAVKTKNIKKIIKYGFKNLKIILVKRIKEIIAIRKIDSKYVITTIFHAKLIGNLLRGDYIKISTEHNYHNNNFKYINKVVKSVRNMDYLICVSNELKDFYKDKIKNCIVEYIPNAIDVIPEYSNHFNNNKLISVGRLEKEKGFEDLIDVIFLLKKEIKDIRLIIIGSGSERKKLESKIKLLKLEENIHLLGSIPSKEVYTEMQNSKLYIMSSHTESFGIVLIEAMANSLPCIAFDSANGAKYLLSNDNGILIKERDKNKMAKKIIELINNEEKYNDYSKKGYQSCKKYSIENIKNKWIKLLNK